MTPQALQTRIANGEDTRHQFKRDVNVVPILGKYSKFASAGDKASVRQAAAEDSPTESASAAEEDPTNPDASTSSGDAPF